MTFLLGLHPGSVGVGKFLIELVDVEYQIKNLVGQVGIDRVHPTDEQGGVLVDGHIGGELIKFLGVLSQVTGTNQTGGHSHPQTGDTIFTLNVHTEFGRPGLSGLLFHIETDIAGIEIMESLHFPVQTDGLKKTVETLPAGLGGVLDLLDVLRLLVFQTLDERLAFLGSEHLLSVDIDFTLSVPPLDEVLATTQGGLKGILVPLVHIRQVQVAELAGSAVGLLTEGGLISVIGSLEVVAEVVEENDDVCFFHGIMSFNCFLLRRYNKFFDFPNIFNYICEKFPSFLSWSRSSSRGHSPR